VLGRRLSSNMPLTAAQYFAGSNPKGKMTTGSQKLVNKFFSNLCFSANALIENYRAMVETARKTDGHLHL